MTKLDPEDPWGIAKAFDIAPALVQEIEWMNDEGIYARSPEERWARVRAWVVEQIEAPASPQSAARAVEGKS